MEKNKALQQIGEGTKQQKGFKLKEGKRKKGFAIRLGEIQRQKEEQSLKLRAGR